MMAKFLIIDDVDDVRTLVGRFLTAKGYKVVVAENGHIGLSHAAEAKPDLILMDIYMPGIDGFEATRRLKGDPTLRHIPVLALSGEVERESRDAIFEAGCDGFLEKPIDFPNLVPTIEKYIGGAPANQSVRKA